MARQLCACLLLLACTSCSAYLANLNTTAEKPDLEKIEAFKARVKSNMPGAMNARASDKPEYHTPEKAEALSERVDAWKGKVATKILSNVESGLDEVKSLAKDYVKKAIRNLTDEAQLNKPPNLLVDPAGNVQNFANRIKGLIGGISQRLKSGGHAASEMTRPEKMMDFIAQIHRKHGAEDEEDEEDQDEEAEESGDEEAAEKGEEEGEEKSLPKEEIASTEPEVASSETAQLPPSSLLAVKTHLRGRKEEEPHTPWVAKAPTAHKEHRTPAATVDIVQGVKDLGTGIKHLVTEDIPRKRKAARAGLKKMKDGLPELGTKLAKFTEQIVREFRP